MMARKEEEKKRESNKTNIMKVRNDPLLHLVIIWKPPLYTPCSVYYNEEKRFNAWISTVATHSIVT